MNKFLNRSNIVAIIVFVVLFGYIGVSYYLIGKEKKVYVIGMCAKEQYPSRYKDILNADNVKEVLKKGCPFNFNTLAKNNSINSTYNGLALTIDMIDESPYKVRIFALRSFGESLYQSITDASLEFGFRSI